MDCDGQGPLSKRRRLLDDLGDGSSTTLACSFFAHELDLEIALRQRIERTIQTRITWASLLQESLLGSADPKSCDSNAEHFKGMALDALRAIEEPCDVVFSRESPLATIPLASPHPRSSVRSPIMKPKPKSLFVRVSASEMSSTTATLSATGQVHVLKLICPTCSRGSFTSLQGLLNHARISHRIQYGNHDECIEACAVVVTDENEKEALITQGTEIPLGEGGSCGVPSVRKLFARAVGIDAVGTGGLGRKMLGEMTPDTSLTPMHTRATSPDSAAVHLTRTLGHHKDTPALAPFLGRTPKRQCINVYDEDVDVDIVTSTDNWKSCWKKPVHKNLVVENPEPGAPMIPISGRPLPSWDPSTEISRHLAHAPVQHTRFHILARLVIADRSRWIPPERRDVEGLLENDEDTHQWALSVSSPSYTLHHTSFLSRLTLNLPDRLPVTLTAPPFVFKGTASKPFLAQVQMQWVGSGNASLDVEHWVDLDPTKTLSSSPTLGEEHIINVELDRNTPLKEADTSISEEIRWDHGLWCKREGRKGSSPNAVDSVSDAPAYIQALHTLLPSFPLTKKDVKLKGRSADAQLRKLPYRLVANPTVLKSLVTGRRKAIEWGRAKAVRDAYMRGQAEGGVEVDLLVADVYWWMADQGLLAWTEAHSQPQSQKPTTKDIEPPRTEHAWCARCGHRMADHPTHRGVKSESGTFVCDIGLAKLTKLPLVNLAAALNDNGAAPSHALPLAHVGVPRWISCARPGHWVAAVDPVLTVSVRDVSCSLGLACVTPVPLSLTTSTAPSKTEIEEHLAPYALLALATRSFLRAVVKGGVEAMRTARTEDGRRKLRGKKNAGSTAEVGRLLVPNHVLQWLNRAGVIAGVVGRLGVPDEFQLDKAGERINNVQVKMEPVDQS